MVVNTIYIARHGFRLNWTNPNWAKLSPTGLAKDSPLSAYGEAQAKELATYLANLSENERPTAIFTSPFYRCIQTCLPIADALSLPLYVEFGLSEWYSPLTPGTGLHPRPTPADDLQRYFPRPSHGPSTTEAKTTTTTTATTTTTTDMEMDTDRNANANANANTNTNRSYIDPRWTPTYLVTRKGESVAELHARCEEFLRAFIARVDGPSAGDGEHGVGAGVGVGVGVGVGHERVLLVSHAPTTIALTRALTGDAGLAGRLRVGCCALTTLERAAAPAAALAPTPGAAAAAAAAGAPAPFASRDVIGRGVWTVLGTPADGSFLAGGVERCWGMADAETHPAVPGSEHEEDGPNGLQIW